MVYNFAPNNWEVKLNCERWINVTYSMENEWITENLGTLSEGGVRTVTADELCGVVPTNTLALLSLTNNPISRNSCSLPVLSGTLNTTPVWRATIGLSSAHTKTSYQGEIDPFPQNGTLLSFGPFLQYGKDIENYLIFLNVENSAATRTAEIEIYTANRLNLKGKFTVRNNSSNIIALNDLELNKDDLLLVMCKKMAGIPLYFSRTIDGVYMSLEHSHPPASFVVHGNRWEAQKLLKKNWFNKVG